jgi:hypothetical protein
MGIVLDKWKGCGISTIWGLRENHPFQNACLNHDAYYDDPKGLTPKQIDLVFLRQMQSVADTPWLRFQARLFYRLARLWRLR